MNPIVTLGSIWPTTVEGWVNLIVFIAGFVAAVAVLIPVAIKLVKKGAELMKDKNWSKIKDIALAAMKEAEIEISEEDLKNLAKYIDETIEWFNSMNKSSKKEETPKVKSTKRARKFLVTEEEEKKINKEE